MSKKKSRKRVIKKIAPKVATPVFLKNGTIKIAPKVTKVTFVIFFFAKNCQN